MPLSGFNDDDRQFLVYRLGHKEVYIVTNRQGLSKTSILEMEKHTLPFKVFDIKLVQKRFLIFTELIGRNTDTLDDMMNYYAVAPLGEELKASAIKLRKLTPGKFLCSYYNPDNDVALIDFVVPDKDNVRGDEIPITSYFYSKSAQIFEVYVEEIMVNIPNVRYDHNSYRRHVTNRFIF